MSKRACETCEQTLHRQEQNRTHNYDKHKHLSSSLRQGFCTSVLFISFGFIYYFAVSHVVVVVWTCSVFCLILFCSVFVLFLAHQQENPKLVRILNDTPARQEPLLTKMSSHLMDVDTKHID